MQNPRMRTCRVVAGVLIALLALIMLFSLRTPTSTPVVNAPPLPATALRTPTAPIVFTAPTAPIATTAPIAPTEPIRREIAIDMASFAAFDEWVQQLVTNPDQPMSPETLKSGLQRAQQRGVAMAQLIELDPKEALNRAVPYHVRSLLSPAIASELEQQIDGRGNLMVAVATDTHFTRSTVSRTAQVNGKNYKAYVYGERSGHRSGVGIPLHGIAIGNSLAVHESPLRVLAKGEIPNPKLPVLNEDLRCPVSGIASREVAVDAGGVIIYLCCAGHIGAIEKKLNAGETLKTAWGEVSANSGPLALSGPLASSWTTGTKSVLYIRVIYADDTVGTNPQDDASCNSMFNSGNTFFQQTSYGLTSMTWVLTPVITLPQPQSYYLTNGDSILYSHAVAAAKAAGYDNSTYDRECVRFNNGPGGYAGQAYVGSRGCWMKSSSAGVLCHELGHNFGLWHANYWNATADSIIGPGSNTEYGNPYDTMGSANAGAWQYNTYEKNLLSWLPDTAVSAFSGNGTYRIYPFDNYSLIGGNMYAVKVQRDATRWYWLDYRTLFTSNAWEMNGTEVLWSPWANSNNGSQILDTTPSTSQGLNDAAVTVGRTFADTNAHIYVTTIAKNATTPPSLDIVVNTGAFPGNHAPTLSVSASSTSVATGVIVNLTATASDSDGDTLAYYWDYGDGNFSTDNHPTESKSWGAVGDYRVHCIVSDMKGGTASASVIVKVGAPTKLRISGTVMLGGVGLGNVRISDGTINTYTDSDGTYTLVGEAAASKTISAVLFDDTFTPGFTNPVNIVGDTTGLDFTAVVNTHKVTGSVKDGTTGVSGVTVTDGTYSAVTDGSGNYSISGLPNGFYAFNAAKAGYQFQTVQPVEVLGADVTLNFTRLLYTVYGQITGGVTGAVVDIGDGVHTGTANGSGPFFYSLQVPPGTWNLKATLAGYAISPSNFTNPINVTTATLGNQNFTAVSGTTYSIAGTITAAGSPLPGVAVSNGAKSSTTDSLGNYVILGVANGSYTLTPVLAGATFSPPTLAATVSSANVTGKNFTANYPFTITTTSPLPVGVVGRVYSQTLNAVAGQTPLTWSIGNGSLPPGLALNAAGSIGGTPNMAGIYSFTLTVTDSTSASTSAPMQVTINPKLAVATTALPSGTMGTAYSKTVTASGGLPPYLFWWVSSGTLPTGLNLSSAGVISGTPTTAGVSTFTLTIEDSVYSTASSSSLTLTINTGLSVTTTTLPPGTAGAAYTAILASTGGTSPVTWSISAGSLPAGLSLSAAGAISGAATAAGAPSFTVKATDAAGASATQVLSITINPALAITTATVPSFNVGAAYSQPLATSGGTGAVTFSLASGLLPVGMTLSSAGVISGTSASNTTGIFSVIATDSVGAVATKAFVLTGVGPLTIVPAAPTSGQINTPYAFTFIETGGTTPLTWVLGSGTLPAGVALSAGGLLFGTPTNAGDFNFTVTLSDSASNTTSMPAMLTIVNLPPAITSGATATPATQIVNANVTFTVGAVDPEAAALTYNWTFGDSQSDTAASSVHAYAVAGTYTVNVDVTDLGGLTVSSSTIVTITDPIGAGGGPGSAGNPIVMTVSKVQGVVKAAGGHDSISITGSIPGVPKGFDPTGKTMVVSVSGASTTFTLKSTGQAKSSNGMAKLRFKPALRDKVLKKMIFQGGPVAFTIKLANGNWAAGWGMDPTAAATGTTTLTSTITLDGVVYAAPTTVTYSTNPKSGGKFKH